MNCRVYYMSLDNPIITISVAAKLLKLHPRTLMLYEKMGLFAPHRTNTNRRLYSKKDLAILHFVKFLTQEKRINLPGVAQLLKAFQFAKQRGFDLRKQLFPEYKPKKLI